MDRVASACAGWPGLSDLVPLGGGNRATVLSADYRGHPVVLKRSNRRKAALLWELDLLDHLRDHGIAVPRLIPTPDGRRHVDGWFCYRHIEGRPGSNADGPAVRAAARRVHEATAGWPQRPGFEPAVALISADRGGDIDLSRMPPVLVEQIRAAWTAVQPQPCAVVHGDLGAGNAIIGRSGEVSLIDWDEARVDDRGFDVGDTEVWKTAQMAWEIATCWVAEPGYAAGLAEDFLAGSV